MKRGVSNGFLKFDDDMSGRRPLFCKPASYGGIVKYSFFQLDSVRYDQICVIRSTE